MKTLSAALKLTASFFKVLGDRSIKRIIEDAGKGILQDGETHTYKNYDRFSHADYKSRRMAGYRVPRLKQYKGKSITSTQTKAVDLTVTGSMFRSANPIKATPESVVIRYREGDKVQGNAEHGYPVDTLRDKNLDLAAQDIEKEIGKDIDKWSREHLKFEIG